jgi:beta-lactamase class A
MLITMRILGRLLVAVALLSTTAFGTFWLLDRMVGAQDEEAPIPAYTLDEPALASRMQEILAANTGLDISISLTDLQTDQTYHYGETGSYTAASITKLLTATLFLHKVELGQANLTDQIGLGTASTKLEKMIVESDNDAWHAFNESLTPDGLRQYAQKLGLGSYDPKQNVIDSNDVARLLTELSRGHLLNNAHTALALSLMQRADMRNYLVAGLPAGSTAYHKVGYLSDRLHDASIIKKGNRSFVLVVFSKSQGSYSFVRGASLFQEIARLAGDVFLTPGPAKSTE